jgi:DNA-binding SARP family transcriptional activator
MSALPALGAALAVQLLHTPQLLVAGAAAHALERKDAALLAMLALDGPWPAERAAALFWPDSPERQARTNLRQRLFRLRKLANADVVHAHGILRLASGLTVDLHQFEQALADDTLAGDGELLGALDYSDNEALAEWVDDARRRWREQRIEKLAARASALEGSQQIAAALPIAMRLVAEAPLHEYAHRRLMRLHYLHGDRAAALAAYEHCLAALNEGLGTRPGAETTELAALVQSSGLLPQPGPTPRVVAILRPPRLCGRDQPWQVLERANGAAALVFLEGEAGIGKTRLLGDFATAHDNAPVFGARPGDAALPYALLARIVRGLALRLAPPQAGWASSELARVAPELGVAAPGQLSALRLQQALAAALTEWHDIGLRLLIIDDLHHADSASLELLLTSSNGHCEQGITWIFGVRSGELPAAAAAWLDGQDDADALQRIALGPLDVSGVQALLASLALPRLDAEHWAPALTRHTGGNPLFVLETLIARLQQGNTAPPAGESAALPAPERIGRLIEQRLAQLSPGALKLARVAAVAGPDFTAALGAQVLGQHALDIADHWRELETAAVIRDAAFAHDLIFEGTLRSIPQAIARLLHHDVALVLQAADAPAARLAAHWAAAQDWTAAGQAYAAAAREACAASRRIEEGQFWDDAVRCHDLAGNVDAAFEARRDSIETALATCSAESVLSLTEGLLRSARNAAQWLDAQLAHGKALLTAGRRSDAMALADQALVLAAAQPEPWPRFDAARLSALALSPGPRAAEGIERLRTFAGLVETQGSATRKRDYYCDLVVAAHCAGRRSEAAALYPLAIASARGAGDINDEAVSLGNLGGLLLQLGRLPAARDQFQHALRLFDRESGTHGLPLAAARLNMASADAALGHYDAALAGFDMVLELLDSAGGNLQRAACETQIANTWLHLGQPARAMRALTPISDEAAAQSPQRLARRLTIEARIDRTLGRPGLARLDEALRCVGTNNEPYIRLLVELDRSRYVEVAEALQVCLRVQHEAAADELQAVAMRARVFGIEALCRAGDTAQAAALARECVALWCECRPADLYWPEALWIAYQALDGVDEAAAQAALEEAADWISNTVRTHVADVLRDAFLHRNLVNRDILTAQGRWQARLPR